jgi:FkbM family methyltransferase
MDPLPYPPKCDPQRCSKSAWSFGHHSIEAALYVDQAAAHSWRATSQGPPGQYLASFRIHIVPSGSGRVYTCCDWEPKMRILARLRLRSRIRRHIQRIAGSKASVGSSLVAMWEVLHFAARLHLPQPAVWRVHPRQVLYPLQVRLRGSSDIDAFDQIFNFQEYLCLRELDEPNLILDLGANVGFSTAYFLSIFPKARVVAVEPDERNLIVCKANLSPYGDRVKILHGAVWSRPATLQLLKGAFRDGREWATRVSEPIEEVQTSVGVQAWDIGSLIELSGFSTVDLLKVDIERAELAVFGESAGSWLHKIRNICIELHGKDCEDAFFAALKDFEYELGYSGELVICRNLRPRKMCPARTALPVKS